MQPTKYFLLLFTILASLLVFAGEPELATESEYPKKIANFGKLTEFQLDSFANFLEESPHIRAETKKQAHHAINRQKLSLQNEIQVLLALYEKSFISKNASKDDRKALVFHESNLSIAVHRQLMLLHDFLSSTKPENVLDRKVEKLIVKMDTLSQELINGSSIAVPPGMGINQVFQSGKNMALSVCKLLAGLCMRKSLSALMDSLDEVNFLRDGRYHFEGHEAINKTLSENPKSVFILVGNHDQPLMDIALARQVALRLGSDQHITMTRKSVYPIPPPEKAGDVVFVVDNDPNSNPVQRSIELLEKNIQSPTKSRVSLAVYPEGMLPYTGGQMPMTVKEGAFIIARKISHQLAAQGIPVFLVQMKTNIIEHLTSTQDIPATIRLDTIEKVPDTPIDRSRPDPWIESRRLRAENLFNQHRAVSQVDVFRMDKVPHSKIPYALEMRSCSRVFAP